jgi:wobble nucleotide-excising tRNase
MKAPDEAKNGIDDAVAEQLLLLQDSSTQVLVYFDRLTNLSRWNPEHKFILVSQKRFMVS